MKTKILSLVTILSLLFYTCKKTDVKTVPPNNPQPPVLPTGSSPITSSVQGNVFNEGGQPVSGVTITVGSKTAITDLRGYFRINNASLDKNASVLTGNMNGYFKIVKTFAATSGVNYIRIKMIKKNLIGTISGSTGGTATLSDGSSVTLPANGVIKKSDNSAYTGAINVYASPIDPSAQDFAESIPGNLMGNDSSGKRVGLQSFGMLAVELESSAAEPLQIASGKTASLSFNIPSSFQATAPSSIPLWYMNDTTGLWIQQGTATKSGSTYTGTVSHFSFWNCDRPINAIMLTMTVTDANSKPLQYVTVELKSSDYGVSYGFTDSLGQVSGLVPFNEKLNYGISSSWQCADNFVAATIGPFTESSGITVVADASTLTTTLSGTLTNCGNSPVTNGYALIYHGYAQFIAPVDQNGNFSISLAKCGSNDSITVIGIDSSGNQQSVTAYYVLSSASVNIGTLNACGQSTAQFVNATIDGTTYSLADSIYSYTYQNNLTFDFAGYKTGTYVALDFAVPDNGTAGTLPIIGLNYYKDGVGSLQAVTPININVDLTEYASAVGQFYAGNFSGSFTDNASQAHTVSCSFRVRRTY
ncbi:MAG TPA: hypothetical protein VKT28_05325 [Puia sp.]|nr:hypothetical protein [Puia sp.]